MKMSPLNKRLFAPLLIVSTIITVGVIAFNSNSKTQAFSAPIKKDKSKPNNSIVQFDKDGKLIRPTGYRKWIYIGTPVTPNDMNGGKAVFPEFHSVYINPKAYIHYEKTGKFPDGTVLVKELVSVGSKEATSGKGYFMGNFIGLEVSIKNKKRFKDEPGNWAYFSFGHKYPLKKNAIAQATSNCNECHNGDADDDFVFTQYYPILRAAKKSATSK